MWSELYAEILRPVSTEWPWPFWKGMEPKPGTASGLGLTLPRSNWLTGICRDSRPALNEQRAITEMCWDLPSILLTSKQEDGKGQGFPRTKKIASSKAIGGNTKSG